MDRAAIAAALGITPSASDADVITAINAMRVSVHRPDPSRFVPRADLDSALARATNAEQALAAHTQQANEARANAMVDQAVKDGKIAPASKAHYLALCQDGGFDKVEQLLKTLPTLTGALDLDRRQPEHQAGDLTDVQKAICAQTGISEEAFKKELSAHAV